MNRKPEKIYKTVYVLKHIVYFIIVRTFDNDIAILTFDSPVTFKSGIQPVCLPSATPGAMEKKFENEGVYITGWGAVKFRGDFTYYTHTFTFIGTIVRTDLQHPAAGADTGYRAVLLQREVQTVLKR